MDWRWFATWVCLTVGGIARAQAPLPPPTELPLGTDGLMQPPVPVPPRVAYQGAPLTNPNAPNFTLPPGTMIALPSSASQKLSYTPRYNTQNNISSEVLGDGTRRSIATGGIIFNFTLDGGQKDIEFATDEAVLWERKVPGEQPDETKTEYELFLSGNVIIRTESTAGAGTQTLRADQVYYDVARNRAIALSADLELNPPNLPDSVHLRGKEVRRLDLENWEILGSDVYSSKMPSDPGLRLDMKRLLYSERKVIKKNIFGIPYRDFRTGEVVEGFERRITSRNAFVRLTDIPVFWLPKLSVDATDPLGPLRTIGFGQDRVFGTQVATTWDMFKLIAIRPPDGHNWRLNLDYLSDRGPAIGTDYDYTMPLNIQDGLTPARGFITMYGIQDKMLDNLGGDRGPEPIQPRNRGRFLWRHQQEVLEGLYWQSQLAALSDKNFLEQYYKNDFDLGPNQETFAYATYQQRQFWGSGLLEPRLAREWAAETQWLPKVEGAITGQSFFDLFVYNVRGSAGYAMARPAEVNPLPWLPTDQRIDTGRFNLNQELSLPFDLGAVKLAPYGVLDLTQYTQDLTGEARGRAYGGGGARASLPFSRLYADANSDLFNVRGLYHKAVVSGDYFVARSDTSFARLPLLDRLNDDAVDQAYRNITPQQQNILSGQAGFDLQNAPWYNPQLYAIRRLVDNRVDTLDSIHVLQADFRQRLQTKRGYPGLEHTVDVATFGVSASYFPQATRDNFGKPFGFLEYAGLWNVGDRVALQSSGWFEPYDGGVRYYNVGAYFDRPDRTSFYFGYRQTDPLNSKAVTASVGYQLSRRYYMGLSTTYDFGTQQALSNSFSFSRTGSDLTVTLGFTYNALQNNFGVQFLVVPNLVAFAAPGRFNAQALGNR